MGEEIGMPHAHALCFMHHLQRVMPVDMMSRTPMSRQLQQQEQVETAELGPAVANATDAVNAVNAVLSSGAADGLSKAIADAVILYVCCAGHE